MSSEGNNEARNRRGKTLALARAFSLRSSASVSMMIPNTTVTERRLINRTHKHDGPHINNRATGVPLGAHLTPPAWTSKQNNNASDRNTICVTRTLTHITTDHTALPDTHCTYTQTHTHTHTHAHTHAHTHTHTHDKTHTGATLHYYTPRLRDGVLPRAARRTVEHDRHHDRVEQVVVQEPQAPPHTRRLQRGAQESTDAPVMFESLQRRNERQTKKQQRNNKQTNKPPYKQPNEQTNKQTYKQTNKQQFL